MWLLLPGCVPHLYTTGDSDSDAVAWTAPDNDWGVTEPPADLVATGWQPGDTVPDMRLVDQHGDTVSLWQFYGSVVLVDVSTMWCAPCRDLAGQAEQTQNDYRERGFVYESVLSEDIEGNPPDVDDLNLWANNFGIVSAPVVNDETREIASTLTPNNTFPVLVLIDREMTSVEWIATFTDEAVRTSIEAHLE